MKYESARVQSTQISFQLIFVKIIVTTYDLISGGTVLYIKGNTFGSRNGHISVGTKAATIDLYNDTDIIVILPSLPDGEYPLIVKVRGKGNADTRYPSHTQV